VLLFVVVFRCIYFLLLLRAVSVLCPVFTYSNVFALFFGLQVLLKDVKFGLVNGYKVCDIYSALAVSRFFNVRRGSTMILTLTPFQVRHLWKPYRAVQMGPAS
jgi:hypothetical protein